MALPEPILETRDLTVVLGGRRGMLRPPTKTVRAVDRVSLAIVQGEVYGLVGESGCGKTTLARALLGLARESAGEILLRGAPVHGVEAKAARRLRQCIQYAHQDAAGSLDPWWSVGASLREAMKASGHGVGDEAAVNEALESVGLDGQIARRYPHELSGGQARRAAIARILAMRPEIIILDEPTAGLDASIQASLLNLLISIKNALNLTIILISHDIGVVKVVCDRIGVMYRGRIVEEGHVRQVLNSPRHPYTCALLAATPGLRRTPRAGLGRLVADDAQWSESCAFHPRCSFADAVCRVQAPAREVSDRGGIVVCRRWREIASVQAGTVAT